MTSVDIPKPIILREGEHGPADLGRLRAAERVWQERDVYPLQLGEIFEITHPDLLHSPNFGVLKKQFVEERLAGQEKALRGNWIYYPWSGVLLHAAGEREHLALLTNRNRELITEAEQETLQNFCVGIVGLSVGSNVAAALAYGGIARTMKLAEFDTLETTNLNRIRARLDQIGIPKAAVVAQQLYEVNPYLRLEHFSEGLTKESLSRFMQEDPKPQLVFEIMDSFEMKIHLRRLARALRIPVVMVTNLGDRLLMDVERYDLDPSLEFFNGRAGRVPYDILTDPDLTPAQKHSYAVLLAGGEKHVPPRALASVAAIGKTLVGRPQLGSTVAISGGVASFLARKIALREKLPGGSWLVDFEKIFSAESVCAVSSPASMVNPEEKLAASAAPGIALRTAVVLGHRLRYAVYGAGEPLLLLHGGTFGWGSWFANIAELGKYFTVYALDLPGAGHSSALDYETVNFKRDFVEVVIAFIRAHELPFRVVGHSFGAWVAAEAARRLALQRLVLVDPLGFSTHANISDRIIAQYPLAQFLARTALKPQRGNPAVERFLRSVFRDKEISLPPEFLEYFYDTMRLHHNLLLVSRLIALRKELSFDRPRIEFPCPTLLVWGAHDPIVPLRRSEETLKKIYNSRIEVFPQAGHVPQIEQAREFNETLIRFLR